MFIRVSKNKVRQSFLIYKVVKGSGSSVHSTFCSKFTLEVVRLSGIAFGKQKLGVTFNFDKQGVIDFTKFSKMTMCRRRGSEANS